MPEVYAAKPERSHNSGGSGQGHADRGSQTGAKPQVEEKLGAGHDDGKAEARAVVQEVLRKTGQPPGRSVWGAFCVRPGKRFINEQADEEVVLLLRAHPITNLRWIIMAVVMLLVPQILMGLGVRSLLDLKYWFMGNLAWYLVTLGFIFEKFLSWYYTVFIVTNERLVDIDFVNLLYRVVAYANLNHIEEPSMVAGGVIRSIFRYGDVRVATAAETPNVEALAVPYPEKVISIISELSEELEKRRERGM